MVIMGNNATGNGMQLYLVLCSLNQQHVILYPLNWMNAPTVMQDFRFLGLHEAINKAVVMATNTEMNIKAAAIYTGLWALVIGLICFFASSLQVHWKGLQLDEILKLGSFCSPTSDTQSYRLSSIIRDNNKSIVLPPYQQNH